ncbi:MAG: tetratricopeptide repeat protein [Rhodoplanes sp.]|uniref:tetratricopeptide repeat protein n=1 Tax=Rhodoplanes sp. TaxID=1968906 RepID=UPI0017EC8308|nr:tetratricopeptide repeat protein [Rhodoplanes sp.]NVO12688.1 tetratricopeptide repeat protein [Rhodoplanes sp.]
MITVPRIRRIDIAILLGLIGIALWAQPVRSESFSEKLTRQLNSNAQRETLKALERGLVVDEAAIKTTLPEGADRRVVLRTRAAVYEKVADFERAEADFTTALSLAPSDPALYLDRGYFYLRRQRYGDAMTDFMAGARMEPRKTAYPYAIGRVYAAMGEHERAIGSYTDAVRIDPQDARALLARAEAKINLERFDEAKVDYNRALRSALRGPTDRFYAYLGRGYAAMVLQDYDAAVADFDSALEIDDKAFNAIVWRAYANERRGRTDLAIVDYERAVAYDPADQAIRTNLQRLRSK